MSRTAVVVANSVTAQATEARVGASLVRKTANEIKNTLSKSIQGPRFRTVLLVDQPIERIRNAVDRAARQARQEGDLFLFFYFGHGVREEGENLSLVFRGASKKREKHDYLPFESLLHSVQVHSPKKALFILDCCYAGAAAKAFDLIEDTKYCFMACTTASTRARFDAGIDKPIGFFTRAILNGLFSPSATVGATNDAITPQKLFDYAEKETVRLTSGIQRPYMQGSLDETLASYKPNTEIERGISEDAPVKSAYSKLRAIILSMGRGRHDDLRHFYRRVLNNYREVFLTPYKKENGDISEKPASWTVLRRYVHFLKVVGIVDDKEIMLTARGLDLLVDHKESYNLKLLQLLDQYLRRFGLTREILRQTLQQILSRRTLPTRDTVVTDLSIQKNYQLDVTRLELLLDILGTIRVFGMPRQREKVYFPWAQFEN